MGGAAVVAAATTAAAVDDNTVLERDTVAAWAPVKDATKATAAATEVKEYVAIVDSLLYMDVLRIALSMRFGQSHCSKTAALTFAPPACWGATGSIPPASPLAICIFPPPRYRVFRRTIICKRAAHALREAMRMTYDARILPAISRSLVAHDCIYAGARPR